MTFIEALAEYHKGKRIRREAWACIYVLSEKEKFTRLEKPLWNDLLADDWIAEEG